ncbi:MAG: ABC transporter ATP-binding protein [Chloroflexi bacterium]|nr:ABC transporter ATP-binding protein [Chloroflexota bacterium]
MSNPVIMIEKLSKSYQLGVIGTGTFRGDLQRWWAKVRGLPNPHLKIGEQDYGNREGETIYALRQIDFSVQQGEATGIIGRNGAGKSTLLKILSRVTAPTSGQIKVKGRIASLLEVGTGFHPELTGRENIFLNGAILGMGRNEIQRKFDEIVDFSGVKRFIDTPVKRYSSGMYVRLAFAVAAHLEPEILIVDEVLAVGDAEFQKKCLGKMSDVAHEGRTVLFVSHNMGAIRTLCDTAILLKNGQIHVQGTSEAVVRAYLDNQVYGTINENIPVESHQKYPPEFEVVKLELINSKGELTDKLLVGEPYECRIYYKVHSYDAYRYAVNFRSNDGVLLGLVSTVSTGSHIQGDKSVLYYMGFRSAVHFLPGTYSIDIVVKNQAGVYVDTVTGIKFWIEDISARNEKLVGAGYIYINAEWTQPQQVK